MKRSYENWGTWLDKRPAAYSLQEFEIDAVKAAYELGRAEALREAAEILTRTIDACRLDRPHGSVHWCVLSKLRDRIERDEMTTSEG